MQAQPLYVISTTMSRKASSCFFPAVVYQMLRHYTNSTSMSLPMKPGTVLKSLAVAKGDDPPTVKPREEYPKWVGDLTTLQTSLAVLRRMPNEEAQNSDIRRFLKLSRRQLIRQKNDQAAI